MSLKNIGLEGQGRSEGSYNQNVTVSAISTDMLNQIKHTQSEHVLKVTL